MAFGSPPVARDPLLLSVGSLCLPLDPSFESTSLGRAAQRMVEEDLALVPIVDETARFVGVVTESAIRQALAAGIPASTSVFDWIKRDPHILGPGARGAEALRLFDLVQETVICIVDTSGGFHGVLTPSRLMASPDQRSRPRMVGGMATPLGVYLTNGRIGAGVPHLGLVLTGAVLFGLFLGSSFIVQTTINLGQIQGWIPHYLAKAAWFQGAAGAVSLALFFLGMRSLPLAGIHAAEHMVVHAIERGEPLEPEVVARMPRVHPRCGTNLAVGAMLFLGIFSINWVPDQELRLLAAALVTLMLWRSLGYLLQDKITTKPATKAQIMMGIKAGTELLAKMEEESIRPPSPWQRILSSGIIQVVAGSLLSQGVVWAIMEILRIPADWRPF